MDFVTKVAEDTYGLDVERNRERNIERGLQYCEKSRNGVTASEMLPEILEYVQTEHPDSAEEYSQLETVIYVSALTHLCPDQNYRINP